MIFGRFSCMSGRRRRPARPLVCRRRPHFTTVCTPPAHQSAPTMQDGQTACSCSHLSTLSPTQSEWDPIRAKTSTLRQVALEHYRLVLQPFGSGSLKAHEEPGHSTRSGLIGRTKRVCGKCSAEPHERRDVCPTVTEPGDEDELMVCLQCLHVGCRRRRHLERHFLESNHFLGIHLQRGEVFCFHCGDYVYDIEFDLSRKVRALLPDQHRGGKHQGDHLLPELFSWQHLSSPSLAYAVLGLRGLYNLGNTCFMNSVLQSLLHNPLLQRFFLSRSHCPSACAKAREHQDPPLPSCLACELQNFFLTAFCRHNTLPPPSDPYDPIVPHRLLHAMWRHASGEHLAGYEQQDAHEFFIALLDAVVTDLRLLPPPTPTAKRTLLPPEKTKNGNGAPSPSRHCPSSCPRPQCDVHAMFQGTLRSDVICSVCRHASTVYEPFNDLSLPLERSRQPAPALHESPGAATTSGEAMEVEGEGEAATPSLVGTRSRSAASEEDLTMAHCLETYTALETLSEPYRCEKCGGPQLSSKQLTIHRLPEILVLHLKRFDARKGRKIERFVRFPTEGLDMSPYLYSSRAEAELFARAAAAAAPSAAGSNHSNKAADDDDDVMVVENTTTDESAVFPSRPPAPCKPAPLPARALSQDANLKDDKRPPVPYDLFAMVEHRGASLQQGHYKAFVKEAQQWFTCNDTWITRETQEDILKSQGYLLFYIKRAACD